MTENKKMDTAVFGAGCFWCVEAVFQQLTGVYKVEPGYCGGTTENPTYKEVCSGKTGHAEVAKITFCPDEISFQTLLEVFFKTHDPTTLNYQGNDIGSQYRSSVFYLSEQQKMLADSMITILNKSKLFSDPIVTEVTEFNKFYPAEDYHRNYFINNPNQGYCKMVIKPKVDKFEKQFQKILKQ